jgi:putative endonuclease
MTRELPKKFGDQSETVATSYLEQNGFVILERNFYAKKLGEIDIIAQKDDALHFIEVKSGRSDFDPVYNITPSKLRKIINSAHYYLKTKKLDMPFSIDALIIRYNEVEFIDNVTL